MSTTTTRESEVTILARVLGGERGDLSPELARHILGLGFSDRDKARMNDLAARNQEGALSDAENEEMIAFSKRRYDALHSSIQGTPRARRQTPAGLS